MGNERRKDQRKQKTQTRVGPLLLAALGWAGLLLRDALQ